MGYGAAPFSSLTVSATLEAQAHIRTPQDRIIGIKWRTPKPSERPGAIGVFGNFHLLIEDGNFGFVDMSSLPGLLTG